MWKSNFPVVLDVGSFMTRAGFSPDMIPKSELLTVLGRPPLSPMSAPLKNDSGITYGDISAARSAELEIVTPVRGGRIVHWGDFEQILRSVFQNELQIDPCLHPFVISTSPHESDLSVLRYFELFFETFNAPALALVPSPVLAAIGASRDTALIVDIGLDATSVVPVLPSEVLPITNQDAAALVHYGGQEVTNYLCSFMKKRGFDLGGPHHEALLEILKAQYCYVAFEPSKELKLAKTVSEMTKELTLDSGDNVTIAEERFLVAELLFEMSQEVLGQPSLPDLVSESLDKCEPEHLDELLANIVVCGGTSQLIGLQQRLQRELTCMFSERDVKVTVPDESRLLAWQGASKFARGGRLGDVCVTARDYFSGAAEF